jgi:hypothetical protein
VSRFDARKSGFAGFDLHAKSAVASSNARVKCFFMMFGLKIGNEIQTLQSCRFIATLTNLSSIKKKNNLKQAIESFFNFSCIVVYPAD